MVAHGVEFVVPHQDQGVAAVVHDLDRFQGCADVAGFLVAWLGVDQIAEEKGTASGGRHEAGAVVVVAEARHQGDQLVVAAVDVGDDVVVESGGVFHTGEQWPVNYDLEMERTARYMTRE